MKILKYFLACLALCGGAMGQKLILHDWPDTVASMGCSNIGHIYRFADASGNLTDWSPNPCGSITAAPLTVSGTVTYSQAGYDSTSPNTNASVAFAPSAKAVASSSTAADMNFRHAGGFEVIVPLSVQSASNFQNFLLAQKSSTNSINNNTIQGWAIYAESYSTGSTSTYGFNIFIGATTASEALGAGALGTKVACTGGYTSVYFPIGNTADVAVRWDGSSNPSNIAVTVNGVAASCTVTNAATASWTGIYQTTVTFGGVGYSNSFAVTFTGGGCTTEPSGWTATAAAGVITGIANTTNTNASWGLGCTSAPTPVLTAGGGTTATATTTLNTADMTNTGDLTIGGGGNGTTIPTGQTMNVAGFASYPNGMTAAEEQQHFAALDWYRNLLPSKPTTPAPAIVTNDFCTDLDGPQQLWVLQRLQQMGYINLIGAVANDYSEAIYTPQWLQYSLARAGMGGVPVSQIDNPDTGDTDDGYCGPTITAVTTAAKITKADYPGSTAALCTALAAQANDSVIIFDGGLTTSVAGVLTASSPTCGGESGAALFAAKVKAYYAQATNTSSGTNAGQWTGDPTSTANMLANWPNSSTGTAMVTNGASPSGNGPGTCNIYNSGSIQYQTWYNFGAGDCAAGTDSRTFWDALTVLQYLFPSWFTTPGAGSMTFNSGTGDFAWSSSPNYNQTYTSAIAQNIYILQAFMDSMMWSDPAYHSPR